MCGSALSAHDSRQVPRVTLRYMTFFLSFFFWSTVGPDQIPPCRLTENELHSFATICARSFFSIRGIPYHRNRFTLKLFAKLTNLPSVFTCIRVNNSPGLGSLDDEHVL